jgi:RNA polymerase sigma-70 factor (ECF subfamily)
MDRKTTGTDPDEHPAGRFPTTHWSRIIQAGDSSAPGTRDALAALCQGYWYPLYTFIRSRGHGADEALDLVQEYFARLLEGRVLKAADPTRGRFRTFLLTDCSHFLAKQHVRGEARKRGGDRVIVSIDAAEAEGRFGREPAHDLTAERLFEKTWALTLLDRVLGVLREEYRQARRGDVFDRLKAVLSDGPGAISYAAIAAELGTTEGAVGVAVHRLRKRYGALLHDEIAATVGDPAEVEDEVRALLAALGP